MAGVAHSDLLDLLKTTMADLPDLEFEVPQNYQNFNGISFIFKTGSVELQSGEKVTRNIVLDRSGNAQHVRLYQRRTFNVENVMSQLEVPLRYFDWYWTVERHEMLMNRAPAKYVDLVAGRRIEAAVGAGELLEERFWQSPESSSDDVTPYGIPYWVPKLTTAGEGFYGGSDTNVASTTAGIDPATSNDNTPTITGGKSLWRSYAAGGTDYYEAVDSTAVRTLASMALSLKFEAPLTVKGLTAGLSGPKRIFTNKDGYLGVAEIARQSNASPGADLVAYQGVVVLNRIPIVHVAYLDTDTSDPFYMIDTSKFKVFIMDGDNFREDEPLRDMEFPDVYVTRTSLTYNYVCLNRRCQGVMNKI